MEFNKIEMLVDDTLTTYSIVFDEKKMEKFKSKLLEYSLIEDRRIIYDSFYYVAEKYCREILKLNYDKILKVYECKENSDDMVDEKVKLMFYPSLYKLLFHKNEKNIFELLLSYVLDENNDGNINSSKKIDLVSEFISLISVKIVNEESLSDIQNQMDAVSKISDRHKDEKKSLLNSMNERLQKATKDAEFLSKLFILIDEKLEKTLSLTVQSAKV